MSDDVLGLPYGFKQLGEAHDVILQDGTKVDCYALAVYFTSARDRKRFASAIKNAMEKRGYWLTDQLRP